MSKIPYDFRTPVPSFFFKTGYLDPHKESYENRVKFLNWAFGKCYSVSLTRGGKSYEPFEFSFGRYTAAEECGLTEKAFRVQLEYHIENGYLKKTSNEISNRCNSYKWDVQKFCEKIIKIENAKPEVQPSNELNQGPTDSIPKKEEGPTDLREEVDKKGPTDFEKGQPKGQSRGQPIYETNPEEKGQPKGQPKGHFYKNDKEAIELSLSNSDNEYKPRTREDLSLSSKRQSIAFSNQRVFNPKTYRLRNGELLTPRMQGALGKYVGNARERLLANISHYEEWVDSGGIIKESHEAYLQTCIKYDYAKKKDYSMQNDLYVRFLKEENNLKQIEILKTVVKIRITENGAPESISKELHPKTFADTLENFIRNNDAKVKNG